MQMHEDRIFPLTGLLSVAGGRASDYGSLRRPTAPRNYR